MKQAALCVAGIFFAILALMQFTRLYLDYPVIIGNTPMPLWINVVGLIATSLLTIWMFYSAKKS